MKAFASTIGADGYAPDAVSAVKEAKELTGFDIGEKTRIKRTSPLISGAQPSFIRNHTSTSLQQIGCTEAGILLSLPAYRSFLLS